MLIKARQRWGDRYRANLIEVYGSIPLLNSPVNPYMMRIQRESDAAQADRAYGDGNLILGGGNSVAPSTFLGSGNARMVRWYSQINPNQYLSGSNANVFAARSGILESANGKPAVFAGPSNSTLYLGPTFSLKNSTIFVVGSAVRNGTVNRGLLQDSTSLNKLRMEGGSSSSMFFLLGNGTTGISVPYDTSKLTLGWAIVCRETTFEVWKGRDSGAAASAVLTYDPNLLVQLRAFTRGSAGANGYQQAIAIFNTALSSATMVAAMSELCDEFGIA